MRIQDWELICCLHKEKSLSKASAVLYTTQPVLTRRLKQIEDELGTVITFRSSKGITFTPQGEIFWQYCENMLNQYAKLKNDLHVEAEVSGTLKIASANSISQYFLPELLGRFSLIYPNINYELDCNLSHDTVRKIHDRSTEIGFFCGDYAGAYKKETLYTHLGYIVSTIPFSLQDLPDLPYVTYQADPHTDGTIEKWWYDHFDVAPYTAIRVHNSNICYEMVKNGVGYGIFLNANQWFGDTQLYYQQMFYTDGSPVERSSYIGYREEALSSPKLTAFIRCTRDYASEVQSRIPNLGVSNF